MNRWPFFLLLGICATLAVLVLLDTYRVHRDIRRNRAAIERLVGECASAEQRMKELEERISRLKNDRRALEILAFDKYRLLRSDQYIIHDPLY